MTTTRITTALFLAMGLLASGCAGDAADGDGDVASLDGQDADEAADSGEDPDAELMDWVECMRDEGVPLDDPVRNEDGSVEISGPGMRIGTGGPGAGPPGGGGDVDEPPSQVDADADEGAEPPAPETMQAAREACGDLPPTARGDRGPVDEQAMQEQMLEFAECMRSEGVADFPDPDFSGSGPGGVADEHASDSGTSDGNEPERRIAIGPFGEIDLEDPATEAAFEVCQDVLAMPGGDDDPDGDTSDGDTSDGGASDGGADT